MKTITFGFMNFLEITINFLLFKGPLTWIDPNTSRAKLIGVVSFGSILGRVFSLHDFYYF